MKRFSNSVRHRLGLKQLFLLACAFTCFPGSGAEAQETVTPDWPAQKNLGGAAWENWTGIQVTEPGAAAWAVPGKAVYRIPPGSQGWHERGLMREHDGTIDLRPWYALRFDLQLERDDAPFSTTITVTTPPESGRHNFLTAASARVQTRGQGWHTVTVPISSFDYNRGQVYFLKFIQEITLQGGYESGTGQVALRNPRLVRGDVLHLACDLRSRPAEAGAVAEYAVTVTNCSDIAQQVALTLPRTGWEGMSASVAPENFLLPAGASKAATLRVRVPDEIPPGAHETQTLVATAENGRAAEIMEFITLRRLPFPYLTFGPDGWDDLRSKVATYPWAQTQKADVVREAAQFIVPEVPAGGMKSDQGTPAVFQSYIERRLWNCALAWKLTGDKKYAQKVALFLRRLADPVTGYPKTLHANSQGIPQEGGFFEGCAMSYDAIQDAGLLNDEDKRRIERTFRLYIETIIDAMGDGGISNWSVFNLCPAAMCALAMQDLARFDQLLHGPCGIVDQLRYGTMNDGWWYEMSLSYNLGCAGAFTKLGLSARPFGFDLLHAPFPVAATKKVGLRPFESENFQGMAFGKFGPILQNTVTLKQMWDGITVYPDYRGVMFGMGDGHEQFVAGGPFELAYYAYRDPAYAAIIRQGHGRDLLYGVAELPADAPKLSALSGHSDNAGIAVLRSQTNRREPREQIQAAFKYGTHGGYHGHFDRISLLSLMRYGRSFYNPETSWFGYGSYMYKWWVQTSLSHNLVVVDGKMQEPRECRLLLFHTGPMMQAVAAETVARWSNPPYMGGYDQIEKVQSGDAPFVPIPELHPQPGEVTDYTEPVRQRRLMIVTDDYVLLADDLQAERTHIFDNLWQLRGVRPQLSDHLQLIGHQAQFDTNPLGSGQFITNVDRYRAVAPAVIESVHRFGNGGKNWESGGQSSHSESGDLHLDEHVLWPAQSEVMTGDYAESWPVDKKVTYEVSGDGKSLAKGVFGAWILGSGTIDLDITGIRQLELRTTVERRKDTRNTLFWGDARIVTGDGRTFPLSEIYPSIGAPLPFTFENIIHPTTLNLDYEGGPIRIAGNPVTTALPAEPQNMTMPGLIRLDLSGRNAVRLKAVIGGDWPVGEEEQLRKTVAVRAQGTGARFLTLIEPHEGRPVVKSATASGPDQLRVELNDGRVQEIRIEGFAGKEGRPEVTLTELKEGKKVREEKAAEK